MIFMLINLIITFFIIAIFAEVVLSWIDPRRSWQITGMVHTVTDPILNPVRRMLPTTGVFDFAPMVVLFGLYILQRFI